MTTATEPVTDLESLLDSEAPCTFKVLDALTGTVKLECTKSAAWIGKLECGHHLQFCNLHQVTVRISPWPLKCSSCQTVYQPGTGIVGWHRV